MKYSDECYKYFSGEKFSSDYKLYLENNPLFARKEYLLDILRNKRCLHIGCCDHVPLIPEKVKKGQWMHGLLEQVCEDVVGIDIDEEAVQFVNANCSIRREVLCVDITNERETKKIPDIDFHYILCGEILEHVDNPVEFLNKMKLSVESTIHFTGEYIITVPNAFSIFQHGGGKGIESINSDHRYFFTPYTIGKVMYRAGILPKEVIFANGSYGGNGSSWFTRHFFRGLEIMRKRPSTYKSFRGDSLIVRGGNFPKNVK